MSGLDYDEVNTMIAQWAISSNDSQLASLALQRDFADELGLELSDWQEAQYKKVEYNWRDTPDDEQLYSSEKQRAFARAMYDYTQSELKALGIENVTLYRGISSEVDPDYRYSEGEHIQYIGNAVESWSIALSEAEKFGDIQVRALVPVENIIGTARTGFGCLTEGEYVITPGSNAVVVGAGGLGTPVLQYLSAAGVGTIGIVDNALVEENNLSRQVLFSKSEIGFQKTTQII